MSHRLRQFFGIFATLVALAACSEPTQPVEAGFREPPPASRLTEGIVWTATTEVYDVAPTRLRVRIFGRNVSLSAKTLYFGACNTRIRLFRAPADSVPVWDSAYKWDHYGMPTGCILPLYVRTIAPGDTMGFGYAIEVPDLMADSVPDGQYHVTAQAGFGWEDRSPIEDAGTGEIAAGSVTLERKQAPLPSVRVRDGVRYEASSSIDNGVITTTVRVTNLRSSELRGWNNAACQIGVYGFATTAARDEIYRPTTAPWHVYTPNADCRNTTEFRIAPGESRIFQHSGIPRSWTAPAVPPGTYHLATSFYAGYDSVVLAAGEIRLH